MNNDNNTDYTTLRAANSLIPKQSFPLSFLEWAHIASALQLLLDEDDAERLEGKYIDITEDERKELDLARKDIETLVDNVRRFLQEFAASITSAR